jgi:hypothetical protein
LAELGGALLRSSSSLDACLGEADRLDDDIRAKRNFMSLEKAHIYK